MRNNLKISDSTIAILRNFQTIQNSIRITPGNELSTGVDNLAMQAKAVVPETFDREFGIYDLQKFIAVISLFKEPELAFNERQMVISSGSQKLFYTYAEPSLIYRPAKYPKIRSDVTFTLKSDVLSSVIKAMDVMSLPELAVVGADGKVSLQAIKSKDISADTYTVEVGQTDKEFQAIIQRGYLKMNMRDYEVAQDLRGMTSFTSNDITYWIANEAHSKL